MNDEKPDIAAVIHAGNGEGDPLVKEFADELTAAGWNVQGLLTRHSKDPTGVVPMTIYSLANGQEFIISQQPGKGSQSCTLDSGGLAQAAFVLRNALEEQADLVIVNRFGSAEAEGKGFLSEIIALVSNNIPVLTLTSEKYLSQWREFTGGLASELSLNKQELHDWFKTVRLNKRH